MKVVSLDGLAINDGVAYSAWLDAPYTLPALDVETADRVGDAPLVSQVRPRPMAMTLNVQIGGASEAEARPRRSALLQALDTMTAAVALVVSDDDGSNPRYRYVVTRAIDERDESRGTGRQFVVTLTVHGDTAWRSEVVTTTVWSATGSGQTKLVANGGDMPARPVYTFQPTADNGVATVWDEKRFAPVVWTSHRPAARVPVDIADVEDENAFDTESLLIAGTIGDETNVGVVVDGYEVRRWVTKFDTAASGVWVNLEFQPGDQAVGRLAGSMGAGDVVAEVEYQEFGTTDGFPTAGMFLVDGEVMTYSGIDRTRRRFLGVSRAAKGTAADDHAVGATIYWLQHDIWLVYGGQTRRTVFDALEYDAYKPMLALEESRNRQWVWDEFYTLTELRSAAWRPSATGDEHRATPVGEPATEIELSRVAAGGVDTGDNGTWAVDTYYLARRMQVTDLYLLREDTEPWALTLSVWGFVPVPVLPGTTPGEAETVQVDLVQGTPGWYTEDYTFRLRNESRGVMTARAVGAAVEFVAWPQVLLGPAIDNYSMALTLANVTTGESIGLTAQLEVGQQLEVDTTRHTVRLLDDGSNQFQALTRDRQRAEILLLRPGNNTLEVTEEGLTGMTITIAFEARSYT